MGLKNNKPRVTPNTPSRDAVYKKASMHAYEAIAVLVEVMKDKNKQDSARVGAAKALLAKVIPDLKAQEVSGKDGEKLQGLVIVKNDGNSPI